MADRVCPFWVGYLLLSPLRKLLENPDKILGQFVSQGMTVLEPGCGMGYFTLPLARMVGPQGRVIAVDTQPRMLSVLRRRAQKADLLNRIEVRLAKAAKLDIEDFSGGVDFATALHVVHEVPDPISFFREIWNSLKSGCNLFFVEPKYHVSQESFQQSLACAEKLGFQIQDLYSKRGGRRALLNKPPIKLC